MNRLRLTLSLAGLGTALMGVLQRNQYLIWIAMGLLAGSVLLRIVAAVRTRGTAREHAPPEDPTS